jgi:hypothetical protein
MVEFIVSGGGVEPPLTTFILITSVLIKVMQVRQ